MTANRIVQHIFQQPDIKQVDEAALERLVTSYPYFTAGRLLLARKQYTLQKNLLAPAVKKAQQYSNNMHYFYRFVTTDEKSLAVAEAPEVTAPEETPVADTVQEAPVAAVAATPAATEVPFSPATTAPVTETPQAAVPENVTPVQADPVQTTAAIAPVDEPAPAFTAPEQSVEDETVQAAPEAFTAPAPSQPVAEAPVETPAPAEEAIAPVAATAPAPETTIHVTAPKTPAAAPENIVEEQIDVTANEVVAATTAPSAPQAVAPPVQTPPVVEEKTPGTDEPIKIFPLNTSETETSLTFQPLYSDDYFAYKRLKEPENAEKLSEKAAAEMKSFTSWLRDLKSTFAEKAATKQWYQEQMHRSYEDADPGVSETVEKMAIESITLNDDLVSETLAEIWAHQRQYLTAIHIYQKLSLLNPNKSAYFAQKIKELQLLTEKS